MNLDYKHANQIVSASNGNILWLGDISAADDLQWLKTHNIRTVITAATGFQLKYDASIRHYQYSIVDTKQQNIVQYFDEVTQKITKGLKYGSVLVHCGAGVSRSTTLVIAYLIKIRNMNFIQALKFVRAKRSVICPNLGFELQLKKYDKMIHPIIDLAHNNINLANQNLYERSTNRVTPQFKSSTPFLKGINNKQKRQRMTMMSSWKPKKHNTEQFPSLLVSKSLMGNSNRSKQINQEDKTRQLKKIAQFRFGITNTEKWKIF